MAIDRFFGSDKEIDTFDGFDDFLDKIRRILERPQQRIAMTRAAQSGCVAEHT